MKIYSKRKGYHDGLCAVNVGFKEVQTDQIYDPREGYMMQVVNHGKWGYIDEEGNEVIPIQFDEAGDFYDGTAIVEIGKSKFCIDKTGQKIRDVIYDTVWSFEDGMAVVRKDNKCGIINSQFEEIIPVMYEQISLFSEDLACIKLNGKNGFINLKNEIVLEPKYSYATSFYHSRSKVQRDGKYGIIDKTGREIIPCIHDKLDLLKKGIIEIVKNDRFIYFDLNGFQITPDYNYSSQFYNSSFSVVGNGNCGKPWWPLHKMEGGKWGVINHKGEEVIPLKFDTFNEAADAMKKL